MSIVVARKPWPRAMVSPVLLRKANGRSLEKRSRCLENEREGSEERKKEAVRKQEVAAGS